MDVANRLADRVRTETRQDEKPGQALRLAGQKREDAGHNVF